MYYLSCTLNVSLMNFYLPSLGIFAVYPPELMKTLLERCPVSASQQC